jgi:hypothetical protein
LIWHACLDPGTLAVDAVPAKLADEDAIDPAAMAAWLCIVDEGRREHAVLSDGYRRIRLDLVSGSLRGGPVVLHYRLTGTHSVSAKIMPLRRLVALCRHRRFIDSLFPPDPRMARWIEILRVHDALVAGASQREIAEVLYAWQAGAERWREGSDGLRSRLRRLVKEARTLARGGYRQLLQQHRRE